MNSKLKLRRATMKDLDILFDWRNNMQTRIASCNTADIKMGEHKRWLSNSIKNINRQLFIAEKDGIPVGTIRADLSNGVYELSWTVSPDARKQGIGKQMVSSFINRIKGLIIAEIKEDNIASKRIAEYVGMKFDHKENGMIYYKKENNITQ